MLDVVDCSFACMVTEFTDILVFVTAVPGICQNGGLAFTGKRLLQLSGNTEE